MATKIKEKKEAYSPLTIALLVVLLLWVASFFFLLAWGLCTSFKINMDFFAWRPKNLFNSYSGYEEMLKSEIARYTVEMANLKELAEEALAAAKEARAAGNMELYNEKFLLYKSFDQPLGAAEQQISDLNSLLTKFQGIRAEMGTMGLPFYTYKYAFKVFSYEVSPQHIVGLPRMYLNSFLYAGGCGLAAAVVPLIAAYACARFHYRFSRIMHTTVILVMMIPIVGSGPSELNIVNELGMLDKIYTLWIMKANFLGLYFLMYYEVCKAFPTSYAEAAKIDGANNFQIFFKIALPLIKNTFFTVFLIQFISFWNDYQAPMIYMPSFPTVAMGLNALMSVAGGGPSTSMGIFDMVYTPSRMAAAVLTAVPVTIIFACFQKRLLGNLPVGGIKG